MDFANRLLDLASDDTLPALERVKFLAIFAGGMDEFFQVRVAGLKDQLAAGVRAHSSDGLTVAQQLAEIRKVAGELEARHTDLYHECVESELSAAGSPVVAYMDLSENDQAELKEVFSREIYPVLTPLAVDPGHPFPYISNLSLNLAIMIEDPSTGESRFARVKVPPLLQRFVSFGDGGRYVFLEDVISHNVSALFPSMRIGATHTFRVTRNADIDFGDSESDDLLQAVEMEIRRRRFGRAVRLEIDSQMPKQVVDLLLDELELGPEDLYRSEVPLDLTQLWSLYAIDRPDLREPVWNPVTPTELVDTEGPLDIFEVLRERDILLHYPYDSFATSFEAFVLQAAADPDVLAIKQTLYRTSGDASFVAALARAAEEGKQVATLIELTARFDEERNIEWARRLEQSGAHVVYGVMGLKTHAKTTLVVRREAEGIRRYCHIGTGNYNADTARNYEDLGILTSDEVIGSDLSDLFNHLTGFSRPPATKSLILAPNRFRPWILEQIAVQATFGTEGEIAIKVNGLTDCEVIDALYVASQAGTQISLIIRGVCSIRPGVIGLSENITVRSVVGRFLEHSRIFRFGSPMPVEGGAHNPATYFLGSGDLMERNLNSRIEAFLPVHDGSLCDRLEEVIKLNLEDNMNAWSLGADGAWTRVPTTTAFSASRKFEDLALDRAKRRRGTETS
jgi:polyphosphate kinase